LVYQATLELTCLYQVSLLNGTILKTVDIIVKLKTKKIHTDKC